jgi:hypothetical protein
VTVAHVEPIPAFVTAGLSVTDTEGVVHYGSEADLRDALAMRWWLAGAPSVQTEVKVPDCGRIDILVDFGVLRYVIEVKQQIVTPTQARQAFQQVHAYQVYLEASRGYAKAFVTAARWEPDAAASAIAAYRSVHAQSFPDALSEPEFTSSHVRVVTAERRSVALSRQDWDGEHRTVGEIRRALDGAE